MAQTQKPQTFGLCLDLTFIWFEHASDDKSHPCVRDKQIKVLQLVEVYVAKWNSCEGCQEANLIFLSFDYLLEMVDA